MICLNNMQIRFKRALQGMFLASLMFLGGCSGAGAPEQLAEFFKIKKENCWPCTMYKVVWEAIGNVVTSSFDIMCENALMLLGIGMLFWITFTIGKLVTSLKEPNLKDFIGNMAGVLFKGFVVAVMLYNSKYTLQILDLVVTPLFTAFVDLGRTLMFSDPTIAKNMSTATSYSSGSSFNLANFALSIGSSGGSNLSNIKDSAIFTANIGNMIQDLIYRLYLGFHSGVGLGFRMLLSTDATISLMGIVVSFIFFYLMLTFPLLFIEAFALAGVVIIFFPFILICLVFPSTKMYVNSFWKVLFVCMAQIVLTCLYMAIMITVFKAFTEDNFSISKQLFDPMTMLGMKNMNDNMLTVFALCYIMFKMTSDIPNISARLVGDFNRSVMAQGIQRAVNITKNVGIIAGGAALAGTGVASGLGATMMAQGARGVGSDMKGIFSDEGPSQINRDADARAQQGNPSNK